MSHTRPLRLLLDYDGTLVPFSDTPEQAVVDEELLRLLRSLSANNDVSICIISGRSACFLDQQFSSLPLWLSAEHGASVRVPSGTWMPLVTTPPLPSSLRDTIDLRSIVWKGCCIEHKENSIAVHYRNASASVRARREQLKEELQQLADEYRLSLLEGSEVFELRHREQSKANAVLYLNSEGWFRDATVIAAGDDHTDLDLFAALPTDAIRVVVGSRIELPGAMYLQDPYELRLGLRLLCSCSSFGTYSRLQTETARGFPSLQTALLKH